MANPSSGSADEWAKAAEAIAKKLSEAPPRSLRAIVEMNLSAIELRLRRGWTVAQLVQDLNEAGIRTTVPVFKNTLYRLRQKTRKPNVREMHITAETPSSGHASSQAVSRSDTPIFKAKAETKNHF